MGKFVCFKQHKNFTVGEIYNCYEVIEGLVYMPYIPMESITIISNNTFSPTKTIKSRYSTKMINNNNFAEIKMTDTKTELEIQGYKVYWGDGFEYFEYFDIEKFNKHFKSIKQLRQEKLNKINEKRT